MPKRILSTASPRAARSPRFPSFGAPRYVGGIRWLIPIVLVVALVFVGASSSGLLSRGPHGLSSPATGTSGAPFASLGPSRHADEVRSSEGTIPSGTEPSGNSTNYNVTFAESGLRSGTKWSVNVSGTTQNATKNQIVFSLPNGTYPYHVLAVPGYARSVTSGNVTVAGAAKKVSVKFTATTYTITFSESGLPANTLWSVTMTPSSGTPIIANSTTSTLTFSVANGSYTYQIASIGGYQITSGTSTGTVTISGASPGPIVVGWSKSPSRNGLSLSLLDYLVIAVVGVWVVVGVVLILRRRRRRGSPRLWTPPPSAKPSAPLGPPPTSPSNPPSEPKEPPQEGTPPAAP